jgi:hypothetical protein
MSKIQERLNALRPYVIGIRYLEGIQLVDAILKEGWTVPKSQLIQTEKIEGDDNYYIFFSDNDRMDIDDLLNYVQEIINLNIEREKKYELLTSKVGELQKIFKDNSLTKLQKLRFTFNEPDILPPLIDMEKIAEESAADLLERSIIESVEPEVKQVEPEVKQVETFKENITTTNDNSFIKTPNKNNQKFNDIELPPKGQKIELEEFIEPANIICKCGPEEICPICEEEKDLTY